MKNKTRLLVLSTLSSILTTLLYYMSYIFNPKFYSSRKPLYVGNFREQGGHTLILFILILLVVFIVLYVRFIIKDSKQLELFGQIESPEYYKKDNLVSFYRIFQYYTIITALVLLIRDGIRSWTYDAYLQAILLFSTDILFIMWDVAFVLFFVLTIMLIIEYINQQMGRNE